MDLAVIDPLPMYRQGVVAVLSAAGYRAEAPSDLSLWVHRSSKGVILLTLATTEDWDLLARVCADAPQQHVIAVMTENSAGLGARAVKAGARSVLPREVTAGVLRRTVEATIDGQTVLPAAVAVVLATGRVDAGDTVPLVAGEHVGWLRHLAAGMPVAELAQRIGYSERATYRLLRNLYRQLGVRNRIEAIVRAKEQGLL